MGFTPRLRDHLKSHTEVLAAQGEEISAGEVLYVVPSLESDCTYHVKV